jgi:hypothetical protein
MLPPGRPQSSGGSAVVVSGSVAGTAPALRSAAAAGDSATAIGAAVAIVSVPFRAITETRIKYTVESS